MKKILTIFSLFVLSLSASAKVITVNNNPNSPGQYSNLQMAIDSASAGDSIYVQGSSTSYGSVSVKKPLYFFGTGNKPNKANNLVSEIGNIQLDTVVNVSGASGTKITGFRLTAVIGYSGNGGTQNVQIQRNYFISGTTKIFISGSGWIIENNIFESSLVKVNNKSNIIIRNNILKSCSIQTSNQSTVVISNNIFLGSSFTAFSNISNALIANNIFSGSTPNGTGVNNNTMSNNITYQTSSDIIPSGTNTGSGNLVAQNPMFVNVPANNFNYSYNFALDSISPGKNAGTDGTDIGIYGGVMPFVDLTGAPSIPQVKSVSIQNPVITVGDSLQVILKANKQN